MIRSIVVDRYVVFVTVELVILENYILKNCHQVYDCFVGTDKICFT